MKKISSLILSWMISQTLLSAAPTAIPGVFSTGVDQAGFPLPSGFVDPHYTVTASPVGAVSALATAPFFMWNANTSSSSWINISGIAGDAPAGTYIYSISFSLNGFDPGTASISGNWNSDNTSAIVLNGNPTGISHSTPWDFVTFDAFAINSGFVSGLNTLSFVVENLPSDASNPTGLQVNILSATAVAVPEPAALAILSSLAAIAVWSRRRS